MSTDKRQTVTEKSRSKPPRVRQKEITVEFTVRDDIESNFTGRIDSELPLTPTSGFARMSQSEEHRPESLKIIQSVLIETDERDWNDTEDEEILEARQHDTAGKGLEQDRSTDGSTNRKKVWVSSRRPLDLKPREPDDAILACW